MCRLWVIKTITWLDPDGLRLLTIGYGISISTPTLAAMAMQRGSTAGRLDQ